MGESTAVVPRENSSLMALKEFAKWAATGRQFKHIKNPQQAMVIMQFGRELGLGPGTSLQSVYEVNGVPALKTSVIAARIKTVPWQGTKKPRYDYRILERSDKRAALEFFERDDDGVLKSRGVAEYTIEDARKTPEFSRNSNYKTRPRAMLFARALTEGARVFTPDCLGGIVPYCPEELGLPCDENGDVIDVPFEVVKTEAEEDEPRVTEEHLALLKGIAAAKKADIQAIMQQLGAGEKPEEMTISQYEAIIKLIDEI